MDFDGTKRKQTIYVGGIHEDSNEAELMEVFSAFGEFVRVFVILTCSLAYCELTDNLC
jgi:RNA recognition motif-containing protein